MSLLKADFGRQITWHCIFVLLLKRTLDPLIKVPFSFLIILLLMAFLKTSHQLHCCSWSSPCCFLGSPGCRRAEAWTHPPAFTRIFPPSGREQGTGIYFEEAISGSPGCGQRVLHSPFGWCPLSMIWDWFEHFISLPESQNLIFVPLEHVLVASVWVRLLTGSGQIHIFQGTVCSTNFSLHLPLCSPIITSEWNWFKIVCGNFLCNFMLHYSNLFIWIPNRK